MDSTNRRLQFGQYLAGLRRRTGKSQRQLAALLCTLSGVQTITRNEVSRWERGSRVPEVWLPFLAAALQAPETQLRQAVDYARGDRLARLPGAAATLAELLPPGDPLEPLAVRTGRSIGATQVEGLAARIHALRLADDVLSGGDLITPAFRELSAAVNLHREASYADQVGRSLLVQIGELAQITGWIASDAGRLDEAEHAYRLGLSAARQAGDGPLTANLAGSLAYQWSNAGRVQDGIGLALAALGEAGEGAPGNTRALFLDRVAWAHAKAGRSHTQDALRALGQAHDALTDDGSGEAPQWAYWVNREELEVMDARVFTELRRPLRAVPLLTDVLGRYDATHARELALYRSWLAVALADANEPEQAAAEALRVIELSGDLASDRTAVRTRIVLERLREYDDVAEVRAVLDAHGHLLLAG
ncbi:helix-turn-helix domain-containing protein [Streptomyces phaeoluteigriseus]|uniref:helix-turn-helix domain-containing protein n=1 Tax=Streptomyces phaeoluteigriseus TaxID=114686 RepID=UPI0036BB9B5A